MRGRHGGAAAHSPALGREQTFKIYEQSSVCTPEFAVFFCLPWRGLLGEVDPKLPPPGSEKQRMMRHLVSEEIQT
jgi:hypothetical protein